MDEQASSRRILAHIKCNLGPHAPSLLYEIENVELPSGVTTARFIELGETDLVPTELVASRKSSPKLREAEAFLSDLLGDRKLHPLSAIKDEAEKHGYRWATVKRAADSLGVEQVKAGFPAQGSWRLAAGSSAVGSSADEPTAESQASARETESSTDPESSSDEAWFPSAGS